MVILSVSNKNAPGSWFMACIIPFLFSCIEILSSDIIRANIAKAKNWLVYAYNQQQDSRGRVSPQDESVYQ